MSFIVLNSSFRKGFAIGWALLEILLFAGLFFGWGTLVFMLKEEGVYGNLCESSTPGELDDKSRTMYTQKDNETLYRTSAGYDVYSVNVTNYNITLSVKDSGKAIGCTAQDKKFNLGFTIVSGLWPFFYGILGQLGHKFGTRFLRLCSITFFICGSLLIAFTTPEVPWLAFVGLFLYGLNGCSLLFSSFQLSYLFENGRSLVSSLMTGSFDSSIATQLYIKVAYDNGIPRQYCYIFIACLHVVALISTFLWLPKTYIDFPEQHDETIIVSSDDEDDKIEDKKDSERMTPLQDVNALHELNNHNIEKIDADDVSKPLNASPVTTEEEDIGLMGYIRSPLFLLHVFWYSILQLRFFYFVGTLNPWLERISQTEEEVSQYTDISMFFMLGGIVTSITAGTFFEMQKRRYKDSKHPFRRRTGPVVIPLMVGTALGVLLSVMQMIPAQGAIYASFISVTAFRSFLYAIGNGYLSEMFPSKYLNSLSGILMVLTAIASFLQYLFFYWTESYTGAYLHVDIILVCLVLTSLVHPIYQWFQCRHLD